MATIIGTAGDDPTLIGTGNDDLIYGAAGNDILDGGNGNDALYGGSGIDTLYGGAGVDFLDGGLGDDVMAGGAGNDAYIVDSFSDVVTENLGEGTDTVKTALNNYVLGANVENLELIGSTGLVGHGNELDNSIKGTTGADTLYGEAGNDAISASDGNDTVYGGAGNDWMRGGVGTDVLSYADAASAVTVSLAISGNQNTGGSGIDNIGEFENLTGSDFNDILTGDAGDNRIVGGLGTDTMTGGAGDDRYSIDNVGDVINENASEGTDLVNANIDWTLGANLENLALFNSAVSGTGNELTNIVRGNDLDNFISGGVGGEDYLYGGVGHDTFVLTAPVAGNLDHINDFVAADDTIQVSQSDYAGLSLGVLDDAYFVSGAAATAAHGQFVFDTYHNLYWDADGTGGGAQVLVAATGPATIDASDIFVV